MKEIRCHSLCRALAVLAALVHLSATRVQARPAAGHGEVTNALAQAHAMALDDNRAGAADRLFALLSSTSPAVQAALDDAAPTHAEPLRLAVAAQRLACLPVENPQELAMLHRDAAVLLDRFYASARDNDWPHYCLLYNVICGHDATVGDWAALETTISNAAAYSAHATALIEYGPALACGNRAGFDRIVALHDCAGGPWARQADATRCLVAYANDRDPTGSCQRFLDQHPDASVQELIAVTTALRSRLDIADPDTISLYRSVVTNLLGKQGASPDREAVVTFLRDELSKIACFAAGTVPAAAIASTSSASPSLFHETQNASGQFGRLLADATARWSLEPDGTLATPSAGSLAGGLAIQALAEELDALLASSNRPPQDLSRFEPVAADGAFANKFFWKAYALLRADRRHDAVPLFRILVSTNNPDYFSLGGSHYWLGHIANRYHRDFSNALSHLLMPHRYKDTCLVYTDLSYMEAADIYRALGMPDTALALYSIMLPNFDIWRNEVYKARSSFAIARERNDLTNAVRQVVRVRTASSASSNAFDAIVREMCNDTLRNWPQANIHAISLSVAGTAARHKWETDTIRKALDGPEHARKDPLLADMLLHEWPSMDYVKQNCLIILTNRPLSNNIFEQKTRSIR